MLEATKAIFTNYFNFKGRTNRRDYWLGILGFAILYIGVSLIAGFIDGATSGTIGAKILIIFYLASLIPLLSMEVRRLHDVNKSGWYLCMAFIPLVGAILVLIKLCTDSVNENNKYN